MGGDPEKVTRADVGWVVSILQYERFIMDYEREYLRLNKGRE
jgi:hypothetical protein